MNTRFTTATVAALVSVLALSACGTTSVDDAEPSAPVKTIGYGNYVPRGQQAPQPVQPPDDRREDSPDGGFTYPYGPTGRQCIDDVHSRICHQPPLKSAPSTGGGTSDRIKYAE
ncbi:MAG: hypothetical protein GX555_01430 [Actinomycetales bacterium]|nr:hypothetical protein [Actinomycetales bacterium]